MPYLFEFLMFLAPFAAFAAWRWLNPGQDVPGAVVWLLLIGIVLGAGGAIWYGLRVSLEPGTVYVPAILAPDGTVMPGRAEPGR